MIVFSNKAEDRKRDNFLKLKKRKKSRVEKETSKEVRFVTSPDVA